jgi:uncharacterized membrane protein YwzB
LKEQMWSGSCRVRKNKSTEARLLIAIISIILKVKSRHHFLGGVL